MAMEHTSIDKIHRNGKTRDKTSAEIAGIIAGIMLL